MRAFKLLSTAGDLTIDLTQSRTIVVGRAVTSDLPIYDPTVSRRHAEVSLVDGGVRVQDLGSSNGTFVNGTKIGETVVSDGDVVTFGKVAFKVQEVTPPATRPPPDGAFQRAPAPEATIVRQVSVKQQSSDLDEKVAARPSGAGHLKLDAESVDDRQAEKLSLLLDISKELSKQQEVDRLLEKVVDITFKVMNVDRVSILMLEGQGDTQELVPRVSHNRLGDGGGARVPQSIARRAVDERLAILTDNAAADERFKGKSIMMQSVRSAMCTPLMGSEGKVLGIIYVDNMTATNSFGDEDLEFLIAFSGIAAVAIENGRLTERIQREAVVRSNFERYFAPDLAEQIAAEVEEVQLGGTKRPVVVFFSDIRGFTSMSENMSPDGIATLLTEYFTEMVEIVFEHGGTLDKFMGDAIMALWGAPIEHDDDADRAMRAAIQQQEMLAQLNEKWTENGRPTVEIGIGINFGEVFAGNIGSERRLEYTVIGDAVNTASRLCSKAEPGEILISEPFYKALKEPPEVEALEPLELKGKAKVVPVYRLKR
ncbi:MAG: adenylate/guanylate cyclase domain-containing protein [Gemmatimonadales bacterium]